MIMTIIKQCCCCMLSTHLQITQTKLEESHAVGPAATHSTPVVFYASVTIHVVLNAQYDTSHATVINYESYISFWQCVVVDCTLQSSVVNRQSPIAHWSIISPPVPTVIVNNQHIIWHNPLLTELSSIVHHQSISRHHSPTGNLNYHEMSHAQTTYAVANRTLHVVDWELLIAFDHSQSPTLIWHSHPSTALPNISRQPPVVNHQSQVTHRMPFGTHITTQHANQHNQQATTICHCQQPSGLTHITLHPSDSSHRSSFSNCGCQSATIWRNPRPPKLSIISSKHTENNH